MRLRFSERGHIGGGALRHKVFAQDLGYCGQWPGYSEACPGPAFAKLPSEQDFQFSTSPGNSPVIIYLPENIQIEVGADCPARRIAVLLQVLKNYITETAMLNGLKPYHYLTYIMEKMKDLIPFPKREAMLEFFPWSASLSDNCHNKLKK